MRRSSRQKISSKTRVIQLLLEVQLRKLAGIESSPVAQNFPISAEDVNLLG